MKNRFNLTIFILIFGTVFAAAQNQTLELYLETGHSSAVSYAGFSADGKILVSKDKGTHSVAKIWDVQTGTELKSFECTKAVLSPDGKTLLTAFFNDIKLANLGTGEQLLTLKGHTSPVQAFAFSPDGKLIVSVSITEIKTWDALSGKEVKTTAVSEPSPNILVFSPDNATLAYTDFSNSNELKLLSVATGKAVKFFKEYANAVTAAAFSKDGRMVASVSLDGFIKIWDAQNGRLLKSVNEGGQIYAAAFSPDGRHLAYGNSANEVVVLDIASEKKIKTMRGHDGVIGSLVFSNDGRIIASGSDDKDAKLWDADSGNELKNLSGRVESIKNLAFSPNGEKLVAETFQAIKIWELGARTALTNIDGQAGIFSPNGKIFAYAAQDVNDNSINLLEAATGKKSKIDSGHLNQVESIAFSDDDKLLATGGFDHDIRIRDAASGAELKTLKGHTDSVVFTKFSPDNKYLASVGDDKTIRLWDVESGKQLHDFAGEADAASSLLFVTVENRLLLVTTNFDGLKVRDAATGAVLHSFRILDPNNSPAVFELYLKTNENRRNSEPLRADKRFRVKNGGNGRIDLLDAKTNKLAVSLIALGKSDWIVTTPEGRFDTNKSLDRIEGLHWIVNDEILKPLSLDVFMRQYYEPNLLQRVLNGEEFKKLPSIADINRVQPKIAVKEVKSVANADGLVDVTVDIESVTDEVSVSAADRTKKKQLISGAYDLRLFRDGQLVGTSTAEKDLANYIKAAPALVERDKASETFVNTEEDKAWRAANDIFKLKAENVKSISPERIEYTFRRVKLPRDGRGEIEFTAYAFNSDKVKSATTAPFKFAVPVEVVRAPRKGRAVIVSIGVNASENPAYNLRYAANDARNMQAIIGERLKADRTRYSEVVEISLVSDGATKERAAENGARKAIIKAVFDLLAGKSSDAVRGELSKQIPNAGDAVIPNETAIKPIEPEDTLIITYAGHGYADRSGIFYLLPFDIGADTERLTTENAGKMISSDELSLWMRDITAAEMIMIIDACHSSAAVQGDGFKPGPMGSRGLGQMAYDKDMKILSATQANNVALELNSLEQGLLSYALLHDGIKDALADADKNKQLLSTEMLSYAERRVPELYQEVKDGKRGAFVDGKLAASEADRSVVVRKGKQKSNLDLQQPSLFDFKRRDFKSVLFDLP